MIFNSANSRGALWMVVAMAGFVTNDVMMKLAMENMGLFQAITIRNACAIVGIFALCWRMKALSPPGGAWAAMRQGPVLLRVAAETAAAYFFLTALRTMPLANATAVLQLLPLSITFAAALFLRETVGWRRWLATICGFSGVLLILRPDTGGFDEAALYALIAVLCVTARDLATRRVDPAIPSLFVSLITAVAILTLGLVGSLFENWVSVSPRDSILLIAAAAAVIVGYLTVIAAMRVGQVSFVAPFRYSVMVWALALGWVVFADFPDRWEMLGTFIIVMSGLYTFWRERRVSLATSIPAPSRAV